VLLLKMRRGKGKKARPPLFSFRFLLASDTRIFFSPLPKRPPFLPFTLGRVCGVLTLALALALPCLPFFPSRDRRRLGGEGQTFFSPSLFLKERARASVASWDETP